MPNKGVRIRNNKRRKNAIKRNKIKAAQIGLLRYVKYTEKELLRISGKYSRHNYKINKGQAVQFEHKIYLADGTYKFVNRGTLWVKAVEESDNPDLIALFNQLQQKNKEGGRDMEI